MLIDSPVGCNGCACGVGLQELETASMAPTWVTNPATSEASLLPQCAHLENAGGTGAVASA